MSQISHATKIYTQEKPYKYKYKFAENLGSILKLAMNSLKNYRATYFLYGSAAITNVMVGT